MALSMATSLPGLNCSMWVACRFSAMPRGSMTIRRARLCRLLEVGRRDRMILGRVGADDDDHVGVLDRAEGRTHGAGADAFEQRRHRGGMAQARAVVDVVGAEAGAHQLLKQVGLFVGALGRAETGQGVAAVAVADGLQAVGRHVQRLLPARLAEMGQRVLRVQVDVAALGRIVAPDQRLGQAVRVLT